MIIPHKPLVSLRGRRRGGRGEGEERERRGRGEGEERERRGRGEGEERERREVDQEMDLNYIKILLRVQANKSKISCYHN